MTAVMKGNRKVDTRPELRLRSALHGLGLRYRLRTSITADGLRVVPDVVFRRARVAVFVDGCWWHSCPEHGTRPRTNPGYWLPKLQRNIDRDRAVDAALEGAGWTIVRVWEHQDAVSAAEAIRGLVMSGRTLTLD